jgi:signal-transduction protein with cAMP-binding, CBS, and nucleotidyltransferase domain
MAAKKISSLAIREGGRLGIFTQGDAIRALAADGDPKRDAIGRFMTAPVQTVYDDDFVFVAIGRMQRLGVRHLPVLARASGEPVGMVSARTLLKLRSAGSLALGDRIAVAEDARALREVHDSLAQLARDLRAEDVGAHEIAEIESALVRDMTARAAALAEAAMIAEGKGPAPAAWCVLVLGSGGRGESLLSADQDNAIVAADGAPDAWYAEVGIRMADMLDAAGIPYCKGGVMAREPAWRGTLSDWRRRVGKWVSKPEGENLLSVDIFFDFAPVHGDGVLAEALRRHALAEAGASRPFLRLLAAEVEQLGSPLDAFGRFRAENGRADLKKGALLAIVGGTRALALRHGIAATGTTERLRALIASGHVNAADAEKLIAAQATVQAFVLDQQLRDIADGLAPSTRVEIARLKKDEKTALKEALRHAGTIGMVLADMR